MKNKYRLSIEDLRRIEDVIASLDPKVVDDWMAQKTIVDFNGVRRPLYSQRIYCTVEGLIKQIESFEMKTGMIYHITNDRTMTRMAIQLLRDV